MSMTTLSTVSSLDERFAWTTELIDTVLMLRFKNATLANAIECAKGNEAKRKAWTALADELMKIRGVMIPENKIRRAMSKWQSQHRSWTQTMATKTPAELTQADRPPSYMPVLQRYFQEGNHNATIEKAVQPTGPVSRSPPGLNGFEAALAMNPSSPATGSMGFVFPSKNRHAAAEAAPMPAASSLVSLLESPEPPTRLREKPAALEAQPSVTPTYRSAFDRDVASPFNDEDPVTSQEDSSSLLRRRGSVESEKAGVKRPSKQRKISPKKTAVILPRCARVSPTQQTVTSRTSCRVEVDSDGAPSNLRALASRVTDQLAKVHQEQMSLQKRHFKDQLALQRKQYEEQFAVQRKHIEVMQTVLESLQGNVVI